MTVREMIIVGIWVFYAIKKLIDFYAFELTYDSLWDSMPDWLYWIVGTLITIVLPFPVCAILYLIFC